MPSQLTTAVRRLVAGLAVAALLVPATASARLIDNPQPPAYPSADLRMPDTRDAAERVGVTRQDLRMPDTRDAAADIRAASPTSSLAGTVSPPSAPAAPAATDDDVDWPAIGIAAALFGGLVLLGFGIVTVRRARLRPAG
ncbi:MAG TPA: hypothetical protein VI006_17895 [Solirubrobacteraceae bacterium]|jgi:hypothetical protein